MVTSNSKTQPEYNANSKYTKIVISLHVLGLSTARESSWTACARKSSELNFVQVFASMKVQHEEGDPYVGGFIRLITRLFK